MLLITKISCMLMIVCEGLNATITLLTRFVGQRFRWEVMPMDVLTLLADLAAICTIVCSLVYVVEAARSNADKKKGR